MALLTTILTVVAVLGGISALLWFCTSFEARHLGPLTIEAIDATDSAMRPAPAPALSVVDAVQTVQTAA